MAIEVEGTWSELFEKVISGSETAKDLFRPGFRSPVDKATLVEVQAVLRAPLPDELVSLLEESNGVDQVMDIGGRQSVVGSLIWPAQRIREDNLKLRTSRDYRDLYMPFDHLLFFADAGNGDLFGYAVLDGQVRKSDIYVWNHEDDSRKWVAPSLKTFIEWSLSGKITT